MDKHKQYTPLKVHNMSVKEWEETDHSHNYYEIIFIEKGKGVHVLNDVEILYKAGSVFVLNPIDHHHFHVHEFTHFISVRFTPAFITNCAGIPQELCNDLISKMESEEIRNARIQFYNEDQKSIYSIFQTVLSCQSNQSVVYFQILSIVQLILKSLQVKRKPVQAKKRTSSRIELMLSYIHNHITEPQMLHLDNMAGHFSISENYISNYFKRNMGITVKRYIDHYRMGLIQNQLTYSNLTIKKIAYDFGFSDESHLNKIFKKYWNMSAKAFREIKKKDLQTQ